MKIQQSPGAPLPLLCAFALGAALAYPAQAAVVPAQSPLFLGGGVSPNLVVTLDTSTSMFAAHTPDSLDDGSNEDTRRYKSAFFNPMYYNPAVKYTAPIKFDGTTASTSLTTGYINGFDTTKGSRNLSTAYRPTSDYNPDGTTQTFANHFSSTVDATDFRCAATICQYNNSGTWTPFPGAGSCSGTSTSLCKDDNMAAYYYVFNSTNTNCDGTKTDDDCYTLKIVSATSGPATADINGDGVINSADQDERQNFANWYSFYRTRTLALISAADLAFWDMSSDIRLAWQNLNVCTTFSGTACLGRSGTNYPNYIKQFTGTHRDDFFKWLFDIDSISGTPLRNAVQRVGEYYKTTSGVNNPYAENPQVSVGTEYSCRKNFHLLMTDGEWNSGGSPGDTGRTALGNLDGTATSLPDGKSYSSTQKPYTDSNSDSLSDVIFKYWSTDLRTLTDNVPPYLVDLSGDAAPTNKSLPSTWTDAQYFSAKNDPAIWQHMVTFTVGLGLTEQLTDPIWGGSTYAGDYANLVSGSKSWPSTSTTAGKVYDLWHGALDSRGQFFSVEDPDAMVNAFRTVLGSIVSANTATAAVATNSSRLGADTAVYQATFDSTTWSGHFLAFAVNSGGSIGTQLWDAGATGKIPTSGRNVKTYNPSATGAPRGADFLLLTSLTATQQAALNANTTIGLGVTALNVGQKTLDYIRGDQSQEQTAGPFRKRTQLLGDIVNSDSLFVGSENFGYDSLPGTEGSSYITFRNSTAHKTRRRMLYFGANDGMLHGIDAGSFVAATTTPPVPEHFDTGTGEEKLAYVPDAVIPNLKNLTNPSYTHQYFVDGSPKAADALIGSAWKTVLLGTTGAGGKAVFALDVTAPDSFDASKVMWEISTTTSPKATDRTTDTTSTRGFQNNLGFTLPQPSLVRMADGSWAAIVANGYGSVNNQAVLYIIDAATGNLIKAIDTKAGSSTVGSENGLSTPIAVDVDNDRITDYIYAGDLQGNLWKFDVTGATNTWDVAYKSGSTPKPLYVAMDVLSNRQPITAKPQVGKVGVGQTGGLMVYFGTGKYFETADTATTQTQTFYGIWDKCDKNTSCDGQVAGRGSLQQQAILQELPFPPKFNLRVSSNCTVNYSSTALTGTMTTPCTTTANRLGWYMDLVQPAVSHLPAGSALGERVVSAPILRPILGDERIIFTTLIPSKPCLSKGTGWLMELSATSGQRPGSPPWDINLDGKIDSNDMVSSTEGVVPPSGLQIIDAPPGGTPGIISDKDGKEHKYLTGPETVLEDAGSPTGRRAWRQLR